MKKQRICRFCGEDLNKTFINLGAQPLSNSYVSDEKQPENIYPLHVWVCGNCKLVQLEEYETPEEIFSEYSYFSSYSDSWLKHAKEYTDYMVERFGFNDKSHVVEIASNDGYLLQYFIEKGIPVLGIEPAKNVAAVAEQKGVTTLSEFFGVALAKKLAKKQKADLLLGNNVLAHVPDINDFVEGMHVLLADDGIITMEFPHLLQLIANNEFDTIYHEHFSYLSFSVVNQIFAVHGLKIFDVEELETHGGSLRIFACHNNLNKYDISKSVAEMLRREETACLLDMTAYTHFEKRVQQTKRDLLSLLIQLKNAGKNIVAYGAAAKGNTLLNYCGIGTDFINYVVDKNPNKQGVFLPGSRIPVLAPDIIKQTKPDYVLVLPWNLKSEITEQLNYIKDWQGKFIFAIPHVEVINAV